MMTPRLSKFALTAHIACSVGWLGALAGWLALAIAGLTSQDAQLVRAADLAMELTARFVIVPLAFASLLTGIVQSLGTPWGLFRHYWIVAKLLLTVFATIVLLLKTEQISRVAAATLAGPELRQTRIGLAVHAGGGLLVLLVITALSVFKPWGRTRYGRRKQQQETAERTSLPSLSTIAMAQPRESPQAAGVTPMATPPTLCAPGSDTTGGGLSLRIKIVLAAIGSAIVGFVTLHLAGGGLRNHGH